MGGATKIWLGGIYWKGIFPGGGDEWILGLWGGDSPHSASRENPAGCIWKTQSEQSVSWVEGFMQNLFSFLFFLVFSGDLYFEFLIVELF